MQYNALIVTAQERLTELEKSNTELRGAIVAAGLHIKKLRHNPKNAKMAHLLRRALLDARAVAKKRDLKIQSIG